MAHVGAGHDERLLPEAADGLGQGPAERFEVVVTGLVGNADRHDGHVLPEVLEERELDLEGVLPEVGLLVLVDEGAAGQDPAGQVALDRASPRGVCQLPSAWMAKREPISRWPGPRMTKTSGRTVEEKTAPATAPE